MAQIAGAKVALKLLGVAPPVAVAVSLLGAKGWIMGVDPSRTGGKAFDRDPVIMPEALLQTFDNTNVVDAAPLIMAIWRAAGWHRSIYA